MHKHLKLYDSVFKKDNKTSWLASPDYTLTLNTEVATL